MSSPGQSGLVSVDQLVRPLPTRLAFERVVDPGEMGWESQVRELCAGVADLVVDRNVEGRFWLPGYIVRTAVEADPVGGLDDDRVGRVQAAARLALGLYAGTNAEKHFYEVTNRFRRAGLLDEKVEYPEDMETARDTLDTRNRLSLAPAMHMDVHFRDESLLFLPLSPKGIVAGMQTFLLHQRYRNKAQRNGTALYPIRQGDQGPSLAPAELDMLREQAKNRIVVVFDAHSARDGEAMAVAVSALKRDLKTDRVYGYVNRDNRIVGSREERQQGKWWQKVDALPEAA